MDIELILKMEDLIKASDLAGIKALIAQHPKILKEKSAAAEITWLHYAARFEQPKLVEFFFEQGIPLNTMDESGESPISEVAYEGNLELVKWMLKRGADPTVNHWPMISAVSKGNLEIVKLFVEKGADYNFAFGEPLRTPLAQAINFGHKDVAAYLKSRNAVMPAKSDVKPKPNLNEEIEEYFESMLDSKAHPLGMQEVVPGKVRVSVLTVKAQNADDFTIIFTTGMSEKPFPRSSEKFRYAEMMMCLPSNWPVLPDIKKKSESWPWIWLRTLAHYPHEKDTVYVDWTTTFANEDPPKQLDQSCQFVGFLLLMNFGKFEGFTAEDGRFVNIITAMPIYAEELAIAKTDDGIEKLIRRFKEHKIEAAVKLGRRNVGL